MNRVDKTSDELNYGYLSHNSLVYTFYRLVDYLGYRLIKVKPLIKGNNLLFINLGLIGDLIIFRYVINDFLLLNYQVSILIRDEYKFLFADLKNVNIITVKNYKEKHILSGLYKIIKALRTNKQKYDVSLHFRGYLGAGILSTYLSKVAKCLIGYPTSGFGFLINYKLDWVPGVHESKHLLNLLQVIEPFYNQINFNCYANYLSVNSNLYGKYKLIAEAYIVIHATSQNKAKNIPAPILKYTVEILLNQSVETLVFVGVAGEINYINDCLGDIAKTHANRIRFIYNENFFNIYGLIAGAKLFIGVDSSLSHISSGLVLPKIIFWHKFNLFNQWCPLGDNFHILNNGSEFLDVPNNIIIEKISQLGCIHSITNTNNSKS